MKIAENGLNIFPNMRKMMRKMIGDGIISINIKFCQCWSISFHVKDLRCDISRDTG